MKVKCSYLKDKIENWAKHFNFILNMHQKLLLRHLFLLFLDICRVCRCEGAPDRPLFHPCICTGSIKFIHQECLLQWLRYSKKEFCELCTHRFSFTPSKNNSINSALSIIEKTRVLVMFEYITSFCHFSLFARYAKTIAYLNSIQWIFGNRCSCCSILATLYYSCLGMAWRCPVNGLQNLQNTFHRIRIIHPFASFECSFNVSN